MWTNHDITAITETVCSELDEDVSSFAGFGVAVVVVVGGVTAGDLVVVLASSGEDDDDDDGGVTVGDSVPLLGGGVPTSHSR